MSAITQEELRKGQEAEEQATRDLEEAQKVYREARLRVEILTRKRAAISSLNLQLKHLNQKEQ